jgi:hypothetical protein
VVESAARGREGEGQLREIQSRVDKDNNDTQEEMEDRLLVQTSKDADKKLRLEQRSVLQGNSYLTFTWEEIDDATSSFSESRKIGTGSNGTVYRGHLNDLEVAIKVLHSNDKTSTKHFNQEVLPEFCASSSEQIMRQHFILIIFSYHSETVSYLVNESYSFL